MQVKDVMTRNVISVQSDDQVLMAAQLMLQNRISGLPVVDKDGELVGIVTEGDFLRRGEIGTQRRRPLEMARVHCRSRQVWLREYVHSSGRKVEEIMTPDPCVVDENETLEKVVELMEHAAASSGFQVVPRRPHGRHRPAARQPDARFGKPRSAKLRRPGQSPTGQSALKF